MKSVICTLFESHYHHGVAALVNSLNKQGYQGDVYAGYLGSLPAWAKPEKNSAFEDMNLETFSVNENIRIHFVSLKTDYHLTNYKPVFMKWLLNGPAKEAENIFYFDPDIIVDYDWGFFEEWVSYGVTVCEDVNSPLTLNHPRRMAWHKYFNTFGIPLKFNQNGYANGGFVGVNRKDIGFILSWITMQEKIGLLIGGLNRSPFPGKGVMAPEHMSKFYPFRITDQDALNITIGSWDGIVSFVGKEAMGFQPGGALMFHALGHTKPWEAKFLLLSLMGKRPRQADKGYWKSASYPIKLYSNRYIFQKNFTINLAAFIGRFYSKN